MIESAKRFEKLIAWIPMLESVEKTPQGLDRFDGFRGSGES